MSQPEVSPLFPVIRQPGPYLLWRRLGGSWEAWATGDRAFITRAREVYRDGVILPRGKRPEDLREVTSR